MKLLIVESPAKARKIKTFLGQEYSVEATMGHIREIPVDSIHVDMDNGFEPTYQVIDSKRDVVAKLQSLAARADEVFIAADPDREGEAIAQSVYDLLDASSKMKCKRVVYHEITKKAILAALGKPRDIDSALVDAAKARQVLDRIIGYKVSPICWRSVAKGTSAGRVQSIALKLVCDRQKEINAFKPVTFWYVDVKLGCHNGEFVARVVVPKDKDSRFLDKKLATDAVEKLKKAAYSMGDVQRSSKSVSPLAPFDTNSLQMGASSVLKWDITKTMKVAQSLYEAGKISYIRTDSFNVSEDALQEVRAYIGSEHGDKYLPRCANAYAKKAAASAQEAHECIRPTHVNDDGLDLDADDRRLYDLIRRRFIACQMAPMAVDTVKYIVNADCGQKLLADGQTISFDGFSKVWHHRNTKEEVLPSSSKGEVLDYKDIKLTENKTKPPDRFTDASLANKLENDGVGRPATRAPIIKSLGDKGYLTKDKAALVPTPMGFSVADFLAPAFADSFMDIKFTASMEDEMGEIAAGKASFIGVVQKFYDALQENMKKVQGVKPVSVKVGVKCEACGKGEVVKKNGKFGEFFACDNYPACKTIYVKDGENYVSQKKNSSKAEDSGSKCPKCGKPMLVRRSDYGSFLGCSGFPSCRQTVKIP